MMELKKMPKVVGCIACGYRTDKSNEIAAWDGCPNCKFPKGN
jgi:predicted Zn-ribbon and HTH transcriptional regulator